MEFSGLSRADTMKQQLGEQIVELMKAQRLTQRAATEKVSLPRSKIAALWKGDATGISLEKLLMVLEQLGQPVSITIGRGASQKTVHYETDLERHVRLHGDHPSIPRKYLSGFIITLCERPLRTVEISADPSEWTLDMRFDAMNCLVERYGFGFRDLEHIAQNMTHELLVEGGKPRGWRDKMYLLQSGIKNGMFDDGPAETGRQALQKLYDALSEISSDISRHQQSLERIASDEVDEAPSSLSF